MVRSFASPPEYFVVCAPDAVEDGVPDVVRPSQDSRGIRPFGRGRAGCGAVVVAVAILELGLVTVFLAMVHDC